MTDQPSQPAPDADQLARIAAIRASRGQNRGSASSQRDTSPVASTTTQSRPERAVARHAALGGRIAAVGIGASGVLGLVAAFGLANATEEASPTSVDGGNDLGTESASVEPYGAFDPTDRGGTSVPTVIGPIALSDTFGSQLAAGAAAGQLAPAPTPIYLTANPIIRTITVQPPPVILTVVDPAPAGGLVDLPADEQAGPRASLSQDGSVAAAAPAPADTARAAPVVITAAPTPATVAASPAPVAAAPAPVPAPAPDPPKSKGSG